MINSQVVPYHQPHRTNLTASVVHEGIKFYKTTQAVRSTAVFQAILSWGTYISTTKGYNVTAAIREFQPAPAATIGKWSSFHYPGTSTS